MSDRNIKVEGSCNCGAIRLAIEGTVARMAQCHCRDCQRASGTGHMSLAFIPEESVTIEGEAQGYVSTTDLGNTMTRYFCPTCGSRVFNRNTGRPGLLTIPVGILEDRSWYSPDAVVYCRNRDAWDMTDESVPNFETMPPPA